MHNTFQLSDIFQGPFHSQLFSTRISLPRAGETRQFPGASTPPILATLHAEAPCSATSLAVLQPCPHRSAFQIQIFMLATRYGGIFGTSAETALLCSGGLLVQLLWSFDWLDGSQDLLRDETQGVFAHLPVECHHGRGGLGQIQLQRLHHQSRQT